MYEPILCLIKDDKAYFTSTSLENQWGDDWDDAPYERNAGVPYSKGEDGSEVVITKIYFESCLKNPSDGLCSQSVNFGKRNFSVTEINNKKIPWLGTPAYITDLRISIYAGCSLDQFLKAIKLMGGKIFMENNI